MGWVCLWTCVSHPGELQKYLVTLLLEASNAFSGMGKSQWDTGYGKIWNVTMCVILESATNDDEWHFLGAMRYFSTFGAHQNHTRNLKNAVVPKGESVGVWPYVVLKILLLMLCPRKFEDLCLEVGQNKHKKKQGQKSEDALTHKTQAEKDEAWKEGKKQQSESSGRKSHTGV